MNIPGIGDGSTGLDAAALARLRELDPDGRHGVVGRVLTAFEKSLTRMLEQLAELGSSSAPIDASVVGGVAHSLKSASASVGALSLARACAEIEQRVRSGIQSDLDGDVQRLQIEVQAALTAVEAMLRPQ
jgi:HPt (histidine-containing phosphotransfer) domain-containing protein